MYVMRIRRALAVILLAGCSTLAWPQSSESQEESPVELSGLSLEELRRQREAGELEGLRPAKEAGRGSLRTR